MDGTRGLAALLETVAARHCVRLPVRGAACGRSRTADIFVLHHREAAVEAQGGVRQGRHRRCRRPGGGQQRFGGRHFGADAVARSADQRNRGSHADRVRVLRDSARPHAVREGAAADLDSYRQPVHRQLPAAGDQPATGAAVGQAAADAKALPVRRDPVLRHARCTRRQCAGAGSGAAAGVRIGGTDDAAVRAAGAAVDHRGDSGPTHRAAVAASPCSWVAGTGPVCSPSRWRSSSTC